MLQLKILHVATKTQQSQKFFKVYFLKKRKVYFLQTKVKLKKKEISRFLTTEKCSLSRRFSGGETVHRVLIQFCKSTHKPVHGCQRDGKKVKHFL